MEIFLRDSQLNKHDNFFEKDSVLKLRKSKDAAMEHSEIHIQIIEQEDSYLGEILDPIEELK